VPDKTISRPDRSPPLTRGFLPYIWLFAGLFVLFLILAPFAGTSGGPQEAHPASGPYAGGEMVRLAMAALIGLLGAAAVVLAGRRALTAEKALVLIVLAGAVLRFGYMLYTPFDVRGHDVGGFDGYGHLAYAYRLFTSGTLPDSYLGQFYHPPLAHIADAAAARLYALVTGQTQPEAVFEAAKLVPCFASCALLIVALRTFQALGFSKRAACVAMAVIAFHPTFILLSASINNDMLMVFFFMAAFLYTIRWYKDPSYKNILLTAVFFGCAMSTKFSGALIAVLTAAVFLVILVRRIKEGKAAALIGQFGAFAVVCFPLGLWYYVRNALLFGQPFGYVAQIGTDSALYVGDQPAALRFLSFDTLGLFKSVYCAPWTDVNLWEYTVKCALFGEFQFPEARQVIAAVLIGASLVLIALTLYAMVRFVFFERKENRLAAVSLGALWLLLMLSFVYFNIKYPFGCTMDFRYIVPTVMTGAAFLGLLYERMSEGRRSKVLRAGFVTVLCVFCAAAAGFYIL
jgi:4-amino-4-deoxy-L-arabinose transferase-like glycosyltransferase